jgi:hypothetical protein
VVVSTELSSELAAAVVELRLDGARRPTQAAAIWVML